MDFTVLESLSLFRLMSEEQIAYCLEATLAYTRKYRKGSFIFRAGDQTDFLGIVLTGSVTIESNDLWGNRTLLSHISVGQVFAETYALLFPEPLLVDVVANKDSEILFLKVSALSKLPPAPWKELFTANLLRISSQKNLALSGRSFHTSSKSARARILSYLNTISLQKNSREFDIPFDRQQMADYLNLERTNMSKELGKMKQEGIIEFRKNHFVLI